MANYTLVTPVAPIVPTALGGGEVAADYNKANRGFRHVVESLNTLYCRNGTPCVNDVFPAKSETLTGTDTRTHRYKFRSPYGANNTAIDKVQVCVWLRWNTSKIKETWTFDVEVNGTPSNGVSPSDLDTYEDDLWLEGVWSLGIFDLDSATVQEVSVTVSEYENLEPEEDFGRAVIILPVRTLTTIPNAKFARSVLPLPQDEFAKNKSAATFGLQWASRMAEAMYQDRVSNLYTSTIQFNEDTAANGFQRFLLGVEDSITTTTQIFTVLRPQILPGVSEVQVHIYVGGGGTLELISDRSQETLSTVGAGWVSLTADVSSISSTTIYLGVLDTTIESVCVFESDASLP